MASSLLLRRWIERLWAVLSVAFIRCASQLSSRLALQLEGGSRSRVCLCKSPVEMRKGTLLELVSTIRSCHRLSEEGPIEGSVAIVPDVGERPN